MIDPTGAALLNLLPLPNGYINPSPGQQYSANFLASATPRVQPAQRHAALRRQHHEASSACITGMATTWITGITRTRSLRESARTCASCPAISTAFT